MFDGERPAEGSERWRQGLNGAQLAAVVHEGPPLLVVAGAGSGKTATLVSRLARLLEEGVRPERTLLLTFSRRAAKEMLGRAQRLAGGPEATRIWGGTFHALANRLLRRYGSAVGLPPSFTIMDSSDSADLLDLVRSELGLGATRRRFPRKQTLQQIYSSTVNSQTKLSEVVERRFPWCREDVGDLRSVFEAYSTRKRAHIVLDYDDLLLYWRVLTKHPSASRRLRELFDHILVDEYQDTNELQAEIVAGMQGPGTGVMAVGDDAQAIYSFRAAGSANMLNFCDLFPGARVLLLEQNYRSIQPILDVSNEVIAQAKGGYSKRLWSLREGAIPARLIQCEDESAQSDEVCVRVLEARERGVLLRQQAVLFRTGHHSAGLEVELARRNIPFVKYGGLKFLEAAHIKDVLGLTRLIENPDDELSWFRSLQLIQGVGPKTARAVMNELGVGGGGAARRLDGMRPPAQVDPQDWERFSEVVMELFGSEISVAAQLERI
ncbi:MAG TPA: ATP-dependent helicase, partial [Actinomycetota bacterium]|nr:ATP-dependent helicase [Actinomycetota bacterium]